MMRRQQTCFTHSRCRWILISIAVFLFFDTMVLKQPSGLLPWRLFSGQGKIGPPQSCTWDYEASWKISFFEGTSPLTLKQSKIHMGETSENSDHHPEEHSNGHHENNRHDGKKHEYHEGSGRNRDGDDDGVMVLDCRHTGENPPSSFLADPFLVFVNETRFLFYEVKNVVKKIGQIGVSKSTDGGKTWEYLGIALEESFHLSYPFVTYHNGTNTFLMIPETNQAQQVRIYETSPENFPFGWTMKQVMLEGAKYVDTSPVFFEGKWWIFTSVEYSLYLYYADDLLSQWNPHPMNPLSTGDYKYGRSAGVPVVFDEYIYRFAQDRTHFYGEQVHIMRVTSISETSFSEILAHTMKPAGEQSGKWNSHKEHHVNAHRMPDGTWVAVVDGDDAPEDFEFYSREGWFVTFKMFLLFTVIFALVLQYFHTRRQAIPDDIETADIEIQKRKAYISELLTFLAKKKSERNTVKVVIRKTILMIIVAALLSYIAMWRLMDAGQLCKEGTSGTQHHHTLDQPAQYAEVVVVTAATSSFFDRLQNFVGSLQFWEPNQLILIYDIGLEENQIREVMCWKNVKLVQFDFDQYPLHVRNLFNYAWKPLVIEHALHSYKNVVYLDSGAEVRRPIDSIKASLLRHGYWGAWQSNTVDKKTRQGTFDMMGYDRADFEGKRFCAGGLIGFVNGSEAYQKVMIPSLACAMAEECIAPTTGPDAESPHNYDQSVFSIMIYANGYTCSPDRIYFEWDTSRITTDETYFNENVLFLRRWMTPKPYIERLVSTSAQCRKGPLPYQYKQFGQAEKTQGISGSQKAEQGELGQCLKQHNNQREPCLKYIKHHNKKGTTNMKYWFELRWKMFVTIVIKSARCPTFWGLFSIFFGVCWLWDTIKPIRTLLAKAGWEKRTL